MTASLSGSSTAMDEVLLRLRRSLPELAEATCARIYAELDSYSRIGPEALTSAVDRNLHSALTALEEGVVPSPAALTGAAVTARERYDSGVPVEEIVRAFRISFALIHESFIDLTTSLGVPVADAVQGSRSLWGLADAFTTRIITEYHSLALASALRDASQRVWVVRRLFAGDPLDDSSRMAIDPGAQYAAVRCEADQEDVERVRSRLERSGSTREAPAIVVADARSCMGVVSRRPEDPGCVTGLGPFVAAEELPRSDRVARMALRIARQLGRTGIQGMGELGWRLAAASRPDVWRAYAERFLTPLEAEGEFGAELRHSVLSWLRHQHGVRDAAAALNVHPNTVRYRLQRFQEVTGSDLEELDDAIGAVWALELGHPEDYGL